MAKIFGQDGTGWTNAFESNTFSGGAAYKSSGYAALFSGNMDSVTVQFGSALSATVAQVVVYGPGGPLTSVPIGTSAAISLAGAGTYTVSISGAPIVSGTTYFPVISLNSGSANLTYNSGSGAFASNQNNSATFPFASPPNPLPTPTNSSIGHEYLVWVDGIVGAPVPPPLYYRRNVLYFI